MALSELELESLAAGVGVSLKRRGWTLAAAESCTGGWIAKSMTDIAGSSAWFDRGFVTYSNQAKQQMLDVSAEALAEHGAVSEAVVRQMAAGALAHSAADWAVAVSGIAGPGGASPGKPVGTVWFAWARRGGGARAESKCYTGGRDEVRRAAVAHALASLLRLSDAEP